MRLGVSCIPLYSRDLLYSGACFIGTLLCRARHGRDSLSLCRALSKSRPGSLLQPCMTPVLCGCALQLAELGMLPEGDADPLTLADKLTQLAIDANDDQVNK